MLVAMQSVMQRIALQNIPSILFFMMSDRIQQGMHN
jgi:hypothetical protein